MSGYLDDFGAKEARREDIIKKIVLAAVILAIGGAVLYFVFRDYREKQQIQKFLTLLEQKQYEPAYELWGCTEETPCPDYTYEKFLQDWGPESGYTDIENLEIVKTRSCADGIIQVLTYGEGDELWLWVSREGRTLGFAPWPVCSGSQVPESAILGE